MLFRSAQMLSLSREARPHDPLGFYRQIQDCLAQVDRRETMARRLGVPLLSRKTAFLKRGHRRVPRRVLALAAVLLAIGAVAAFVLPAYLHHKRVIQAEEPIGVPIGVPDALVSATQNQAPSPNATADSAKTETASTDSAAVASQNQATPPVQPAPAASSKEETAPPAVVQAPPAPPPNTRAVEPESKPPETTAPTARTESAQVVSKAKTDTTANQDEPLPARAVAPEVRRAEPAPPSEGPEDVVQSPRTEQPKLAAKSRSKKSEAAAKSSRKSSKETEVGEAEREDEADAQMPPVPRGTMRAKFVGVTADGQWMLMLPSHKIVVVPPPRSYPWRI